MQPSDPVDGGSGLRRTLTALLALLLAVPAAVGAVGAGVGVDAEVTADAEHSGRETRGSIVIEGDGDFQQPTAVNGVRSGSGTAEDPYVISNWTIVPTQRVGVRLVDTTAHVLVERVEVLPAPLAGLIGVRLIDAENVTVRDAIVTEGSIGMKTDGETANVTVERVRFGGLGPALGDAFSRGVMIDEGTRIGLSNVSVAPSLWPLTIDDADDVTVRDSSFLGDGSFVPISNTENVSIARSLFSDSQILTSAGGKNFSLLYSDLVDGERGWLVSSNGYPTYRGFSVCGNRFEDLEDAFYLSRVEDLVVRGNVIANNGDAADIVTRDLVFERNAVRNSSRDGLTASAPGAEIHNNTFENNAEHNLGSYTGDQNATQNWWGASDGPNVTPINGSGDSVERGGSVGEVLLDPWRTSPAAAGPDAVDCGVPQGPAGTKAPPAVTGAVRAEVSAEADPQVESG